MATGARVQMEKAQKHIPESPSKFIKFNMFASNPQVEPDYGGILAWPKIATKIGVVGDPTTATKEKG